MSGTGLSDRFRALADVLDSLEEATVAVSDVRFPDEAMDGDEPLPVDLTIRVATQDGGGSGGRIDVEAESVDVDPDGSLVVCCTGRIFPGEGDDQPATRQPDAPREPPYKDPDRLREVYDACDSFAEMTEALGVHVTPETVRRHMIEFGIHEPRSRRTNGSERDTAETSAPDGEEERVVDRPSGPTAGAPGEDPDPGNATAVEFDPETVGLPDGVSAEDLKSAVRTSRTLHEVGRKLGIERERAREVLQALDLLECVTGRLADADRDLSDAELDDRIRTAVGDTRSMPGRSEA